MGLKGRLTRGVDGALFHANVGFDVIVAEEPPLGKNDKPVQVRCHLSPIALTPPAPPFLSL